MWPHVTTCLTGYVNLWVEATHGKLLPMFGVHWSGASGDVKYLICHQFHRTTWFKDHVTFLACHHPVKFGSHRYYGSRDICLVCHVFWQFNVTLCEGSCDFLDKTPLR